MDEPIGIASCDPIGPPEPKPPSDRTIWLGANVSRRELIAAMGSMFAVLLIIMVGYGQKESRDIASVRAEQKAGSEAIINEIRKNDKDARDRSKASGERYDKMNTNISTVSGKMDAIIRELSSQGKP